MKNTFGSIPISMANHLKSEAESIQYTFEMVSVIDERGDVGTLLFLREIREKQQRESCCHRLKQSYVEESIRLRIDGGV